MTITYVGSNTATTNSGLDLIINLPAMIQNDLVLVFSGSRTETGSSGVPSTSGYTLVSDQKLVSANGRLYVAYKFMGATPNSSVTITGTGSADAQQGLVLVFRGVYTTTPLDVAVVAQEAGGGTLDPAPITPTRDDCCIVVGGWANASDTTMGSIANYLPSPSVQCTILNDTLAAAYRIKSGGAGVVEDPLAWSTFAGSPNNLSVTIALRPFGVDLVTVDRATITVPGKAVAERDLVAVSKATVGYVGKTIGIPDSSVESIFVDKYRMVITGQAVNPFDTVRAVTVTPAAVLYRGRAVTVRDIQFEDIPRYSIKGRGSGIWMETR